MLMLKLQVNCFVYFLLEGISVHDYPIHVQTIWTEINSLERKRVVSQNTNLYL